MKILRPLALLSAVLLCLMTAACSGSSSPQPSAPTNTETPQTAPASSAAAPASYRQISAEEAISLMKNESGYVILDVRTRSEYDAGHIPGAICIPNESIGTDPIPDLPDKDKIILVYCRSGRRSKEAAQKLADMGYTDIIEFGGIIDWPGEVVTEKAP